MDNMDNIKKKEKTRKKEKIQSLSEAELEIMQIIWEGGISVGSAYLGERLKEKGWKPNTLLTFLSRLCEKGYLVMQKQGKSNSYNSVISKEEYKSFETQSFLKALHGGSMSSFLTALSGGEQLEAKELDELKEWLKQQ